MKNKNNTPASKTPAVEGIQPVGTLAKVKASFIAGVKGCITAQERITEAFLAAVPVIIGKGRSMKDKKKLRVTLSEWAVEAGMVKKTAENFISRLMKENGLAIRHRDSAKPSEEMLAAVAELLEWLEKNVDEKLDTSKVLKVALDELNKAE